MRAAQPTGMRVAVRKFLAATLLVPALAAPVGATVGDPGETYPVRFKVRASALFVGERIDKDTGEEHDERWTRREVDVLSFDTADTFRWETPLRNGLPLTGWYTVLEAGSVRLVPDLTPHHVIRRFRFPWVRIRGCVLREAGKLTFSKDGTRVRGTTSFNVFRTLGEDIGGRVWVRFRGKRV